MGSSDTTTSQSPLLVISSAHEANENHPTASKSYVFMICYSINIENTAVVFVILARGIENWIRAIAAKCVARAM
jgi:hypothetical protein